MASKPLQRAKDVAFVAHTKLFAMMQIRWAAQRCTSCVFFAGKYLAGGQAAKLVVDFFKLGFTLRPVSLWANGKNNALFYGQRYCVCFLVQYCKDSALSWFTPFTRRASYRVAGAGRGR